MRGKLLEKFHYLSNEQEWDEIKNSLNKGEEIIIFKYSPACGTSFFIEKEFDKWFKENKKESLKCLKIDVINKKPLSRTLGEELNVDHQSPQLIWLDHTLNVKWHASHLNISDEALNKVMNREAVKN
jgi:bacillithiol system protein YtxJ